MTQWIDFFHLSTQVKIKDKTLAHHFPVDLWGGCTCDVCVWNEDGGHNCQGNSMNKWLGSVCNPSREYRVSSWNEPTGHGQVQNWGQYPSIQWRWFPQRGRPIVSLHPEISITIWTLTLLVFAIKTWQHFYSKFTIWIKNHPIIEKNLKKNVYNWMMKYRHLLP